MVGMRCSTSVGLSGLLVLGLLLLVGVGLTACQVVPRVPMSIVFVADKSGSMAFSTPLGKLPIELLKQAILDAVDQGLLDPGQDRQGLIAFDTAIRIDTGLLPLRSPDFQSAVRSLSAHGGTCINPAVERAVDELAFEDPGRSRAVILLSDGEGNQGCNVGDTAESPRTQALIERALLTEVVIYTIGLKSGGDFNDAYLRRLAEGTCGRFIDTTKAEALRGIFADLLRFIKIGPDPYLFGERRCP